MYDGCDAEGIRIRRQVMGDKYVNDAMSQLDSFSAPFQDYLNIFCWGGVWARDGISQKTRSLLTVALLASMRSTEELSSHIRGALRNGCSQDEIREVLLHTAAYCGVPVAVEGLRVARSVLDTIAAAE